MNQCDLSGVSPLMMAADAGSAEAVVALLEAGAEVDLADKDGVTPLMPAAHAGSVRAMSALLNSGADVTRRDRKGSRALHYAARGAKVEAVTALLRAPRGAEVLNKRDAAGQTPLMVAADRLGAASSPSCSSSAEAVLVALLEAGAEVNPTCCDPEVTGAVTPLMAATRGGSVKAVRALLAAKAELGTRDREGCTAWISPAATGA